MLSQKIVLVSFLCYSAAPGFGSNVDEQYLFYYFYKEIVNVSTAVCQIIEI